MDLQHPANLLLPSNPLLYHSILFEDFFIHPVPVPVVYLETEVGMMLKLAHVFRENLQDMRFRVSDITIAIAQASG